MNQFIVAVYAARLRELLWTRLTGHSPRERINRELDERDRMLRRKTTRH